MQPACTTCCARRLPAQTSGRPCATAESKGSEISDTHLRLWRGAVGLIYDGTAHAASVNSSLLLYLHAAGGPPEAAPAATAAAAGLPPGVCGGHKARLVERRRDLGEGEKAMLTVQLAAPGLERARRGPPRGRQLRCAAATSPGRPTCVNTLFHGLYSRCKGRTVNAALKK